MQPLLYPITKEALHQLQLVMEGEFGYNTWSNNCFRTSPTDPIRVVRDVKPHVNKVVNNDSGTSSKFDDFSENVYFLKSDYDKIISLLDKLSNENNWDQNRKVFIGDHNIDKLCNLCVLMLQDYYDYFVSTET